MKKSISLTSALLTTFVLAGAATSAFAATTDNGATWNSNTSVTFTEPTTETPPPTIVDPEDPTVPLEPSIPGTAGNFAIDYVSDLNFGTQVSSVQDQTYYAAADSNTNGADFLQMHDLRSTWSGWNITVQQQGELATSSGAVLTGATVTYTKGNAVWTGSGAAPTGIAPTAASSLTVNNAAQTVMSADANMGMGQWSAIYGAKADYGTTSPISLFVPGNTPKKAAAYNTTFVWALNDTPAATTPAP